ncbi:hypothetical protein IMG5_162360 [Ichthyophthirius multifiliis]|uniref:Sperm-tail PG-rich repeat protein n=1 Tax=Ichthyophthirius multifiliis TaxID=5932 RepID=G0R073_ICHMU|nr:hypothetical protein IMG5_162360 [Ichthyophthirius multifiliis]EGR29133.1 hypothetical protein IMG5_162360 [Ichthyophthirius multifiliis]|eukprot:XP_004030369.1 hypothetical protein IMG5_162360 [Ichthyophthirius multifiliis]
METNSFISKTTNATGSIKGSCMFLNRKRNPEIQKENPNTVPLETPGPGEYNPKTKRSINAYHSSFISRSNRDKYLNSNNNPAPGDYNIRTTVLEKKPFQHKGFMSSFSNNVQKHQKADRMQDLVKFLDDGKKKLIIGSNQPIPEQELFTPGPSSYNPKLPDFRPQYLNSQITSNFKEGVKDRFGDFYDQSKNKKPFPGPQAYKKEDIGFNQIQSAMVSGYVFMSETARKPYGDFHKRLGPSRSIPYYLPQQKSFHLNLARNWV